MLEVSSLRSPASTADQHGSFVGDHVMFPTTSDCDGFMVDDNLLDYIDFSCDVPFFDADGDILPDLEVDPTELLAEFSSIPPDDDPTLSPAAGDEAKPPEPGNVMTSRVVQDNHKDAAADEKQGLLEQVGKDFVATTSCKNGEEGSSAVTTEDSAGAAGSGSDSKSSPSAEDHSKKKAAAAAGKNSHGKRKVKVDWTPELHRRFVQAVEQLGIDKAVPSRILEIMGMDGLTRHNIASHLQKYRSHRKHLMAREAEAATWAHKRHHMYATATARKDAHNGARPWVMLPPTIGFPPPAAAAAMAQPPPPAPFCRPLHVWGHPPVEAAAAAPTMLPVWPRHLAPPRPLPPWAPVDPAYWHQQQYNAARKWSPQPQAAAGTPCVPPPAAMVQPHMPRFPVPGMVPHPMYRPPTTMTMVPTPPPPPQTCSKLAELQLQLDAHPSKESIDAAIGDVLVKPWLPLPLGLKPPSLDSVMSELHKHGIPNIPPAAGSAAAG